MVGLSLRVDMGLQPWLTDWSICHAQRATPCTASWHEKKQINTLNLHTSSKSSMSISRNKGCRRNRWHNLTLAINIQIQRCLNKCPENINMMLLGHRIKSRYHGVTSSYQESMSSYHGIASRCCCFWILGELLKGMWGELLKGMWGEISKVT